MKVDHGTGYRVYYSRHGDSWSLLLCGGSQKTQNADISAAIALAKQLEY